MIYQRVIARSIEQDGCLVWQGAKSKGYGLLNDKGTIRSAHRIAYEHEVGPIPEGLVIDHLCRNRACVRVAHMEVVTQSENASRGMQYRHHGQLSDLSGAVDLTDSCLKARQPNGV